MNSIHENQPLSLNSKFVEKLYNAMSVDLYATNIEMITGVGFYFLMKLLKLPIMIMKINPLY